MADDIHTLLDFGKDEIMSEQTLELQRALATCPLKDYDLQTARTEVYLLKQLHILSQRLDQLAQHK
jgi:hypothetical protein